MLLLFPQFALRHSVRNPLYILNPPVTLQENVTLPRFSVLHYLDTTSDIHFPSRELPYLKEINANKKVPIYSIMDLDTKDEVGVIENKYAMAETRRWLQANLKHFKAVNLLEVPNTDTALISVFNYNLLKDLYRYKTSLLSRHYQYYNLYKTQWNHVKKALLIDQESRHFVSVTLPNSIPNVNVIDVILKFNTIKFSRVITDENMLKVIDLYRWFDSNYRSKSTLSDITDEDSQRVVIEFQYKGYSTFLPLSVIQSLSESSKLESNIKYNEVKIKKLFILMLHRLQDKVNAILESNKLDEIDNQILNEPIEEENEKLIEDGDDDIEVKDSTPNSTASSTDLTPNRYGRQLPELKKLDELNKLADDIKVDNLEQLLDSNISKFEEDSQEVDKIYEESILKVKDQPDVLEEESQDVFVNRYTDENVETLIQPKTLDTAFNKHIQQAVEFKTLTSTEIRSLKKLKENRTLLKSPYNQELKLDDYKIVTDKDTEITVNEKELTFTNDLVDTEFKQEVLNVFDKKYVKQVLKKDVVACVSNIEKAGIIIKNYEIEENRSSLGNYEVHKLTIKPIEGKESTVYFRLPIIDSEGEYIAGNIKYKQRKVRQPLPIVKVSPIKVALTSNYNKLFIGRTERKANDPYSYVVNYIKKSYIDEEGVIKKIIPGNKTLNKSSFPNTYHTLASEFNEIRTDAFTLLLNPKEIEQHISPDVYKDLQSKQLTFCGYLPNKSILVMGEDNVFYNYTTNQPLGTIVELLNIDQDRLPSAFSTIKLLGDDIPLGVCLSYYLGLDGLLTLTGCTYEILERNARHGYHKDEVVLRFNDAKLVIKTPKEEHKLLFNGFLFYKDFIKQQNVNDFNVKDIYLNLLETRDSGLIHIKELNLLEELFLDPITIDVLRSMNEPDAFIPLLLRSNELLKDFTHPDINDPHYARIRGYDRVPGLMYRALAESVREYRMKGRSNSKIELDPYKVWNYITQDSSVKITEDINPVLDIKENETVTLTGMDGLSKDATPKMVRRYHENDIGLVSEGTVDSSDVALNFYLSPYAKLKNTRGIVDTTNKDVYTNRAKAFSTSAQLVPGMEYDSPLRINFVQIQNAHTIYTEGYHQPLFRTGQEYLIPYRVGKLYCAIAEQDGVVVEKTDKLLTVKYKDNTTQAIKIGNQYGRMEGSIYPHAIVCKLTTGAKFKQNDHLAYNSNFFEEDWLDPSRLIMKFGMNVTTALTMTNEVYEDSSAISAKLSNDMSTYVIKERIYILEFDKNVINILPEGSTVEPNTILFSAVDNQTDYTNLSESSIEMLQGLASLSPRAKYNGVIDRYEIKYNGELSDMSPSLRKLATRLDRELYDGSKGTEYEAKANRVTSEYRSQGKNLNVDTLEFKVFIRVKLNQGIGDKGAFAGQMKSVICDVYRENIRSESGLDIDAFFSFRGCLNRQVLSPILSGTTNRLLKHVSSQAADIYFGK